MGEGSRFGIAPCLSDFLDPPLIWRLKKTRCLPRSGGPGGGGNNDKIVTDRCWLLQCPEPKIRLHKYRTRCRVESGGVLTLLAGTLTLRHRPGQTL